MEDKYFNKEVSLCVIIVVMFGKNEERLRGGVMVCGERGRAQTKQRLESCSTRPVYPQEGRTCTFAAFNVCHINFK